MNFGYLLSLPIAMSLTSLPFIIYYTVNYFHYKNVYFENIQRGTIVDCDTVHRGRMGTTLFIAEEWELLLASMSNSKTMKDGQCLLNTAMIVQMAT